MEAIAERAADHPEIIGARKNLVEHPFGTIKFWWGQGAVLTRGRVNVQAELSLSAWAYNFRRVLTILGAAGLRQALQKRRKSARYGSNQRLRRLIGSQQRRLRGDGVSIRPAAANPQFSDSSL